MPDAPEGTVAAEEITPAELRLAARNHGLPLEALRYDVTPAGLHYLLIHYDIPPVDAAGFRLEVAGAVDRPQSLSLQDLQERPRVAMPITFECAGNGRALLQPRPLSQPWLTEAVGTAEWGGTPLAPLLAEAGVRASAIEVLFSGLDHGVEGGSPQAYERSLALADAEHALLAYEMNGAPLPPQHGFPLRLVVPGWYGMSNVKWLARITLLEEQFEGYQNAIAYRMYDADGEPGESLTRMLPRSLMAPPGVPDFMTRERHLAPGPATLIGRAWSRRRDWTSRSAKPPGAAGAWNGMPGPASTCSARAPPTRPATCSRSSRPGTSRVTPTTPSSASRSWWPPLRLPRPCASSPASSPPAASTSATTSGRSAATWTARTAPTRRSTASWTCTPQAWPTTRPRYRPTCSTRPRC
jgi:sulfane dehydrogenase subunit SoxC